MQNKPIYEFSSFRFDLAQQILSRDGQSLPLTPKVFETLRVLIENNGNVVDKDELLQNLGGHRLSKTQVFFEKLSVLRKVLKETGPGKSFTKLYETRYRSRLRSKCGI